MKKFKDNGGNQILKGEGFYISYNPSTGGGHSVFTDLGNLLGADLKDGEETALVLDGDKRIFSILEGDFRKDYEKLLDKGYKACKKFFDSKKSKFASNWSTNEEDRK